MFKPDLIVCSIYNSNNYQSNYKNLLSFSEKMNIPLLVYQKKDNLRVNIDEEIIHKINEKLTIIEIPNYGRCDYTFLYYIVKNYKNLPNKILFTKTNYNFDYGVGPINIENCITKNDYEFMYLGREPKIVLYNKNYNTNFQKNHICYPLKNKVHIETQFYTKETADFENTFKSYMSLDFFKMVYGDIDVTQEPFINFGQGPCFCVSKKLITQHSVKIYEKLLDTFYPNKNHWTIWDGCDEKTMNFWIGKRYHDQLIRFWNPLFTHNINLNIETDYLNFVKYY